MDYNFILDKLYSLTTLLLLIDRIRISLSRLMYVMSDSCCDDMASSFLD